MDSGSFLEGFCWIFVDFWEDFGTQTMIRATKETSMDGWMDGWRRPNHMRSHLDALRTMVSVDLRRFLDGFHSVAKRASFCIGFRADFGGFWKPKLA